MAMVMEVHGLLPLAALPTTTMVAATTLTHLGRGRCRRNSIRSPVLRMHTFHTKKPKKPLLPLIHTNTTMPLRSSSSSSSSSTSGTTKPIPSATSKDVIPKEQDLAFVAGATGRVGSRTVRELLKVGFRVRAGVRNKQRAESLIQSVKQLKSGKESDKESLKEDAQYVEKLEIVECDLEMRDEIGVALGNASVVICCIGASEKEVFDVTGPYRIDYLASKNLIDAATVAKVDHFIFVSSLGTNKVGFPAAILNLFWGVLIWKRKAEEALIASGLPYTIVRPGGMERPTDRYKETHNIKLSPEDILFGGQVSNLQVAELMAFMAKNLDLSYCKVVEVIAETTAPLRPFGELLVEIPSQSAEIYSSKGAGATSNMDGLPLSSLASEASSTSTEQDSAEGNPAELDAASNRDLDLLTTVSEIPGTPSTDNELVEAISLIKRPSSPYTAYEDLKPPSSPRPNPPDVQRKATVDSSVADVPQPFGENGAPDVAVDKGNGSVQELSYYRSPFPVYDDLKPPTSPSPKAPNSLPGSDGSSESMARLAAAGSDSSTSVSSEAEEVLQKPHSFEHRERPHSPYTMYDDMKPPSSPRPPSRDI